MASKNARLYRGYLGHNRTVSESWKHHALTIRVSLEGTVTSFRKVGDVLYREYIPGIISIYKVKASDPKFSVFPGYCG